MTRQVSLALQAERPAAGSSEAGAFCCGIRTGDQGSKQEGRHCDESQGRTHAKPPGLMIFTRTPVADQQQPSLQLAEAVGAP
jgi:hypothetical protein